MTIATLRVGSIAVALLLALSAPAMAAGEHEPMMKDLAASEVKPWLANDAIVAAVKAQNAKNAGLTQADIDALDKTWRAEAKAGGGAMISAVLGNALSAYLSERKAASAGMFTEIFVMDAKGLNVGQSDVTSDYWQGDEAKWQKTFLVGANGIDISAVETDESTQTLQSQLSLPIVDPANCDVIGAVTVGVNVEMLGG